MWWEIGQALAPIWHAAHAFLIWDFALLISVPLMRWKGHLNWQWWFILITSGPIGGLVSVLIPFHESTYMDVCPACNLYIPKGAMRCPHCTTVHSRNVMARAAAIAQRMAKAEASEGVADDK